MKHEAGQLSAAWPARAGFPPEDGVVRTRTALLWAVAVSLLLAILPWLWPAAAWIAWPQVMVATLVHEFGHGIAALVSGGGFESLRVYADGSGVAMTRGSGGGLQSAWVAAGGPGMPPLLALLLFVAARKETLARVTLGALGMLLLVALALWVRNFFAAGLVLVCAALASAAAWRASGVLVQAFTGFVAVQLCLATLSRLGGLFQRGARTGAGELASDTMQMAQGLGGPHWFWAALLVLFSLLVLALGLWVLWRSFGLRAGAPSAI